MTEQVTRGQMAGVFFWHRNVLKMADLNALLTQEGEFLEATLGACAAAQGVAVSKAIQEGAQLIETYAMKGIELIFRGTAAYPVRLAALSSRMPVLAIRGDGQLLKRAQVAIVGSREVHEQGIMAAAVVAEGLIARGFMITSGGALGIDALAHRAAVAMSQPTVVVTATGADAIYPKENADIFRYAWSHGVVVSQYPMGTSPQKCYFPTRNELMAGLSLATCVVQCRQKSGALYTARAAHRLGRPVFAVAMPGFDSLCEGGIDLVKAGKARLVSAMSDFDILGEGYAPALPLTVTRERKRHRKPKMPEANEENVNGHKTDISQEDGAVPPALECRILRALARGSMSREALWQVSQCDDLAAFQGSLLEMELRGWVTYRGGQYARGDF
ncbi:MAG: DNA-protecting protein DprA [Proteobacteria bacterium]|nr:DNA-protecting protein DprA [Pseudomonadota bacterium]